jgi:hypothetical protein
MWSPSSKFTYYYALVMCGLMSVYSLWAFVYVMVKTKFKWVQFMIGICLLQNLNTIYLMKVQSFERTAWHKEHRPLEFVFIFVGIFFFYFTSNLMYWLFGFKYWVMAIEVPLLIENQQEQQRDLDETREIVHIKRFWTERRYNVLNWIGTAINLLICLYVGYRRAYVSYLSSFGPVPRSQTASLIEGYCICTGLLFVSAFFLADALRRLKKSFDKDRRLQINHRTMCLHATALFIHTFFLAVCQAITVITFLVPSPNNTGYLNYSRMILYAAQSSSQAIVIYLFLQFAKPVSLKKEIQESDSDYEDEFDSIRDPNLDMMYYVKSLPKLKRLKEVDYEIDDSKGVAQQLFESSEHDGEFEVKETECLDDDDRIEGFTSNAVDKWGIEET